MVQTILDLFASAKLVKTEKGYCDPQFVGLALLARTLSNLKGTLILLDNRSIVEARVLTRCCIENAFWAVGLTAEGDSFVREMQNDTIHHQRQRGQNLFATGAPLDEEVRDKLRAHLKEIGKQYQNPAQLNPSGVAKRGSAARFTSFMSNCRRTRLIPPLMP